MTLGLDASALSSIERQESTHPLLPIELRELPRRLFSQRLSLCEYQVNPAVAVNMLKAINNIYVVITFFIGSIPVKLLITNIKKQFFPRSADKSVCQVKKHLPKKGGVKL